MITLTDMVYTVGTFRLQVSLEVGNGEYFVIMGPTGSGKTACIECLAGLRLVQSGRVEIGGLDMTRAEPRMRSIGYVPQDYALFFNRTVRGNIAFGPEAQGWGRREIENAVLEAARVTGIENLLDRRIPGMSGGERQRVALARAIAVRPKVLILDEPVSALDEYTREEICDELRGLQRQLGITTLHICHNIEEATSVADRAALVRKGRIEQVGGMDELLRHPRTEFAARFMRCENIFHGTSVGTGASGGGVVRVDGRDFAVSGGADGAVTVVIRPENMIVMRSGDPAGRGAANIMTAKFVRAVDRGSYVRVELDGFRPLVAHMSFADFRQLNATERMELQVIAAPGNINVIPAQESGPRISG